jgi:hypothetical protein
VQGSSTSSFAMAAEGSRIVMANPRKYSGLRGRVNNNHAVLITINTIHGGAPLRLVPLRSCKPQRCIPGRSICHLEQKQYQSALL